MELISTRNSKKTVSFRNAVLDCIPQDGGLYVPANEENLHPWIMYMDEKTSFSSIAGTLTAALLKEEFSPVVSERIAGTAFNQYSPLLRQLDNNLYTLELFHGPTGSHKDFGIHWLASALEHILTMEGRSAMVLAATSTRTGRSMAAGFAGKKHLKVVLVYAKGTLTGIEPEYLAWNGGNIWPVEIEGTHDDAESLVRGIFTDRDIVLKYGLTLANTANIGRLLPQVFPYMYAFSRLRKKVDGDIFYAVPSGNFGNLVAGLYAWKFSLPVNGFITDATPAISRDISGRCMVMDSIVPLDERDSADPAKPSNLERLEQVFAVNPALLGGLVFPEEIRPAAVPDLIFEAYKKYGVFFDTASATVYGALNPMKDYINSDGGTVVLLAKDHPFFEANRIRTACGEAPKMPESVKDLHNPVPGMKCIAAESAGIRKILAEFAG
ncbi:threonine synthase [Brucepastera parasyntrophica]|uniref:pyridoxal-phosphate dependent enzyme n=1 Tax=Brucepastera parasyntrophica TaxID=2880008 RepID=UPI00210BA9CD|nr:pyridoxal-phosphate dependent enzyme [Brucepastera parasyntrophica]ULQ59012.1 threonine synthase [Brucepastera parasyntrophica]